MLLDQDATRQHRKEAECKEETQAAGTLEGEGLFPQTGLSKDFYYGNMTWYPNSDFETNT